MSHKASRIRCVLLDLDGTLYESKDYSEYFDSQMASILADFLKVKNTEAVHLLRTRVKEVGSLTRAVESLGMNRSEFHQRVAERVNPKLYLSPCVKIQDIITHLKSMNLRVGLVSNSGRLLVSKILDALNVDPELFDATVTGTDVEPKPSHQPFLMALSKIGCNKTESVYVGDRDEAEIRPAHEVGLKTILLDRGNRKHDAKWADVVINDLSELENAVLSLTPFNSRLPPRNPHGSHTCVTTSKTSG